MSILVHEKKNCFHRWELSLLLGVAAALLLGTWLSGQQNALAERVVRLHVIGASDSEEDQAAKLQVRDAVLAKAEPWLEGTTSQEEAMTILAEHLEELAQVGAAVSGTAVTASLEENAWFPTKEYTDFALPAGYYSALKITLAEGGGRNWWCVVFPPLCMGSVSEPVAQRAGNFSEDQIGLITGEKESYVVKFKAIELWDQFSDWMEGR